MKKLKRESKIGFFVICKSSKLSNLFFLTLFSCTPILLQAAMSPSSDGSGLETVQISDEKAGDQGNWVKKKNWLLKSYEINSNIYKLASQIAQTKKIYQSKYNAIDEEFDKFYKDLGIEEGKAKELFDNISRYLEKKKTKETGMLAPQPEKSGEVDQDFKAKIEVLESQIKHMESDLEQLRLDMDAIADLDKSLTLRLQKVDEQITSSMTQTEAAKTKVEDLWDIIDDKKARAIYYEVLNIQENLKAILSYLQDVLAGDFDKVVTLAKEKIALVTSNIKKLEEKGLIIKDRSHRVEQMKLEEMRKLELESAQAKKAEESKPVVKEVQKLGIVQRIYASMVDGIAEGYELIKKCYNFVHNLFTGKSITGTPATGKPVAGIEPGSKEISGQPSSSSAADITQKQPDTTVAGSTITTSDTSPASSQSTPASMPAPDQLTMPMP